jgi:hypothetical protein
MPGRAGSARLSREESRMDAESECHLLFVPVRESGSGMLALRTGQLLSGQRVGLAFTSAALLLSVLGPGQPWIRLHEDAMRDMLEPAGIDQIRVDACLSTPTGAPAVTEPSRTQAGPPPSPPVTVTPRRRVAPYRCASLRPSPGRHRQLHAGTWSARTSK